MFNNPFGMVVAIVAIVMIANVLKARYAARGGDRRTSALIGSSAETDALRAEVKALKDRVAVLERLATDGTSDLEREFAKLKNGD